MGLAWMPDLTPRENLEELVVGAQPPGHREESVALRGHQRLALVHRAHHVELRQPRVRDLAGEDAARDDADDLASGFERGVGHGAHDPHAGPAVDEPDALAGQGLAERARRLFVDGPRAEPRAAEDAESHRRAP